MQKVGKSSLAPSVYGLVSTIMVELDCTSSWKKGKSFYFYTVADSKSHVHRLELVDFDPFCVFFFSTVVDCGRKYKIIVIDGSEKRNRQLSFEPLSVTERRSKARSLYCPIYETDIKQI